jgi:hypothetical protein
MGIKHKFTSPAVDGGDPDEVGPDEWNEDHTIDGQVNLPTVTSLTDPADDTPANTGFNFGAVKLANRNLPAFRPVDGIARFLQSFLGRMAPKCWIPLGNSTTIAALGSGNFTALGTATAANVATTNMHTMATRVEWLITAAATTAIAAIRDGVLIWNIGDANGGFHYVWRFGLATGSTVATHRGFCGMTNSASNPTDVNPSSLTNMIGVGFDNGDANFQIMYNDASGTATKVDTGIPVPSTDRTGVFELAMFCNPGESILYFEFTRVDTGDVFTATATTDLPANTVFLAPRMYHSVGGTSSVVGIVFFGAYIEKPI